MAKIRVWKLGNLDHGIVPSQDLIDKLQKMLTGIPTGETVDLVWGPDLEVIEVDNSSDTKNIVE